MTLNVFISYAHEDQLFRQELDKHLSNLKRQNIISSWYDGDILPGTPWRSQIVDHLKSAEIILLLVSSNFIASDFCYSVQLEQAIARHNAHQAYTIPILLRPTDWEGAPFADLKILPTDAKAVSLWPSHDEAFQDVVQGIRRIVSVIPPNTGASVQSTPPATSNIQTPPQPSFQPIQPKPEVFKLPGAGSHFLDRPDHTWMINLTDNVIENMAIDDMKGLLRDILPPALINSINFRYEAPHNIATTMIGRLEVRGSLNPPHIHALGAFLYRFIENDYVGYDAQIHIVVLLFKYTLIIDHQQIEKLSAQFQVPSPLLIDQQFITHPFTLGSSSSLLSAENVQERLESLYHQRRYLLDVKFLSEGAKAARSVCRIDFDMRGEGTGFLIAPDLILTNYHVMIPPAYKGDIQARAQRCEIKFGVIEGMRTNASFTLHPTEWRQAESEQEDLDFIVLKLNRPVTMADQIEPLAIQANSVQKDAFVNIIQHPAGKSMEVSLRFNQVVDIDDRRIYYLADTESGSSGSPVFDDAWRLVALHQAGGIQDATGKVIVAANIGVPINAIRARIASLLQE